MKVLKFLVLISVLMVVRLIFCISMIFVLVSRIGKVSGSLIWMKCCGLVMFMLCVVLVILVGMVDRFVSVFVIIGSSVYRNSVIKVGVMLMLLMLSVGICVVS